MFCAPLVLLRCSLYSEKKLYATLKLENKISFTRHALFYFARYVSEAKFNAVPGFRVQNMFSESENYHPTVNEQALRSTVLRQIPGAREERKAGVQGQTEGTRRGLGGGDLRIA